MKKNEIIELVIFFVIGIIVLAGVMYVCAIAGLGHIPTVALSAIGVAVVMVLYYSRVHKRRRKK